MDDEIGKLKSLIHSKIATIANLRKQITKKIQKSTEEKIWK